MSYRVTVGIIRVEVRIFGVGVCVSVWVIKDRLSIRVRRVGLTLTLTLARHQCSVIDCNVFGNSTVLG